MNTERPRKAQKKLTYADTGVDRQLRAKSKTALKALSKTYRLSRYGSVVNLPYGNVFPIGRDTYLDLTIEGVGTKVLLAQLADRYDTIGIDGVAMAVNDVIRSGAKPLAIADNIHAHESDTALVKEWMRGIVRGAEEAECIVPSGEIGDVPQLIKGLVDGKGFDMVFASVGQVHRETLLYADNLEPGDVVIGLRSSGVHSNGISLARKVLFKQWGGKYEPFDVPDGLNRELILEALEPTRIYVKAVGNLVSRRLVKAAVHITGDAYLKFDKLSQFNHDVGFKFDNFKPQPIFSVIQESSEALGTRISDNEMFKTFNMGWGFAVVVANARKDEIVDSLERSGAQAEQIGRVTASSNIVIEHGNRKLSLKG